MEKQRYKGTHKGTRSGVGEEDRWGAVDGQRTNISSLCGEPERERQRETERIKLTLCSGPSFWETGWKAQLHLPPRVGGGPARLHPSSIKKLEDR